MAAQRGVRAREALLAEGWVWRFLATEQRAREARETYVGAGFEVRLEPVVPGDVGPECLDCASTLCRTCIAVYTRLPEARTP